eukprot:3796009-Alexandrium_andersonii.AAC.1
MQRAKAQGFGGLRQRSFEGGKRAPGELGRADGHKLLGERHAGGQQLAEPFAARAPDDHALVLFA